MNCSLSQFVSQFQVFAESLGAYLTKKKYTEALNGKINGANLKINFCSIYTALNECYILVSIEKCIYIYPKNYRLQRISTT